MENISDQFKNESNHKRKSKEHAKCILFPFIKENIRITPIAQPHIDSNGFLSVSVRAEDIITNKLLYVDNPLQYVNPPVKVQVGAFTTDERGIKHVNYKEDVYEALKQIIIQTVKVLNQR